MKRTLAVFFGGRTVEHDISVVTGTQLIENADSRKYDILPVYIARDGRWFTGDALRDVEHVRNFDPGADGVTQVYLPPSPRRAGPALLGAEVKSSFKMVFQGADKAIPTFPFDIAIPAMHGLNGEDGTIQGLFEMADVPYAESGVLGSSAGMDKVLMKAAFRGAGLPVLDSEWFWRDEWEEDPDAVIADIERRLEYPIFVKPANLGSSIGISRATDRDGLYEAIEIAVRYDRRILTEAGVVDIAEYNCAVLGSGCDVRPSVCEQPIAWDQFLSFEDKYLRGGKGSATSGMKSMSRVIPAPIEDELSVRIQDMSVEIFKLFDCKGVVRIDYIFDKADSMLYVNEINTIPGSFAFYLYEPLGIGYPQLIDEIVECAVRVHKEKSRNVYAFDSDVLIKTNWGGKSTKR